MIKVISVPIILEYKIGNKRKWKRSKKMAEVSIQMKARLSRRSKAYTFITLAWKSFILAVRQLIEA